LRLCLDRRHPPRPGLRYSTGYGSLVIAAASTGWIRSHGRTVLWLGFRRWQTESPANGESKTSRDSTSTSKPSSWATPLPGCFFRRLASGSAQPRRSRSPRSSLTPDNRCSTNCCGVRRSSRSPGQRDMRRCGSRPIHGQAIGVSGMAPLPRPLCRRRGAVLAEGGASAARDLRNPLRGARRNGRASFHCVYGPIVERARARGRSTATDLAGLLYADRR
jgi:hypothetical protein